MAEVMRASSASALRAENRQGWIDQARSLNSARRSAAVRPSRRKKQVLKWFLSKEWLMGLSGQVEFSAAKMSKVLLWVKAHMH
jgi:hypothetical protein